MKKLLASYKNFVIASKREHIESNALNSWKLNFFDIIDKKSFYCNNLESLPPKPKLTFRHLKKGVQGFHRQFVLAPADMAANNVIVVKRMYQINILKQEKVSEYDQEIPKPPTADQSTTPRGRATDGHQQ